MASVRIPNDGDVTADATLVEDEIVVGHSDPKGVKTTGVAVADVAANTAAHAALGLLSAGGQSLGMLVASHAGNALEAAGIGEFTVNNSQPQLVTELRLYIQGVYNTGATEIISTLQVGDWVQLSAATGTPIGGEPSTHIFRIDSAPSNPSAGNYQYTVVHLSGNGSVWDTVKHYAIDIIRQVGTGTGTVDSVVAGNLVNVDATDPANPIVSVPGKNKATLNADLFSDFSVGDPGGGYRPGDVPEFDNLGGDVPTYPAVDGSQITALTKAQVGLANVDNTSDADKPVSTLTQTALDGKAATGHTHTTLPTTDQKAALDGAATPNAGNVFATMADVGTGGPGIFKARFATTANVDLATGLNATSPDIDGVNFTTGDIALVKDQTTATENGLYIVPASGSAATSRLAGWDTGDSVAGELVVVKEGTAHADTFWLCTNNDGSDVVGTDALAFMQNALSGVGDASQITTGTFANGRIAASNVTQHEGSLDHDNLLNVGSGLTGGDAEDRHRVFLESAGAPPTPASAYAGVYHVDTSIPQMTRSDGATWQGLTTPSSDANAIHDNVASEISALSLVTAAAGDHILIEDASDANNKKRVAASDFLGGGGALTDLSDVTLTAPDTDAVLIKSAGDWIDGTINTNSITDDAVTLAKMAAGTAGTLISYDASGNPAAVPAGATGHVLTQTASGVPTFQAGGSSKIYQQHSFIVNIGSSDSTNWYTFPTNGSYASGTYNRSIGSTSSTGWTSHDFGWAAPAAGTLNNIIVEISSDGTGSAFTNYDCDVYKMTRATGTTTATMTQVQDLSFLVNSTTPSAKIWIRQLASIASSMTTNDCIVLAFKRFSGTSPDSCKINVTYEFTPS